ncbi:MAG: HTTM domain-containing protein [Polyangiaceae bacterium]
MSELSRRKGWLDEQGELHLMGVVRVLFSLLFADALYHEVRHMVERGYFADYFHMPFFSEAWVPNKPFYLGLLALKALLILSIFLGKWARPSLIGMVLVDGYLLLCDRLEFHNNRYAILCFAFLLAWGPCDRAVLPLGPAGSKTLGPLFAQRLAQLQMSVIYIASSGSKLLDPDWRGGDVMSVRFARGAMNAPAFLKSFSLWMSGAWQSELISKGAIATEMFLAFGLWSKALRPWALWVGALFHLTIEATANVQLFSWLSLSVYVLFADPDTKTRSILFDPRSAEARRTVWVLKRLDWLAKFDLEEVALPSSSDDHAAKAHGADQRQSDHGIISIRRPSGELVTGLRAFATLSGNIPLFLPLWGFAKAACLLNPSRK